MGPEGLEPELLHRFKNRLAIALGFCNLLLDEIDKDDPRRDDLLHIQQSMQEAMALLPELANHMK